MQKRGRLYALTKKAFDVKDKDYPESTSSSSTGPNSFQSNFLKWARLALIQSLEVFGKAFTIPYLAQQFLEHHRGLRFNLRKLKFGTKAPECTTNMEVRVAVPTIFAFTDL